VRALVKRDHGAPPRIERRQEAAAAAGEVLVAIRAVGICGTDLHILDDRYPHAEPLIPGHEFAGEVIGPNDGVGGWNAGDRVVGELHVGACLVCETCRSGNPQICPAKRALGTWSDGAFAELLAIPAWLLHPAPEAVSDEVATLVEPAACAWHGLLERSHIDRGDTVLVVGHGPIGLLSAHIATAAGARTVLLAGRSGRGTARLDCARALGIEVIDATSEDVEARVADSTAGRGVDLAVEAAGSEASLDSCVRCCRRGGRVVVLGVSERPSVPFPWGVALQHDLTVAFSFSSRPSSWAGALGLIGRDASVAALITHVIDLDEWEAGFAAARSGEAVKVVLTP
jgi:L-iditol 2-dehydrogenase